MIIMHLGPYCHCLHCLLPLMTPAILSSGLGSGEFTMEELKTWMADAVMAPDGGPQHFEKV